MRRIGRWCGTVMMNIIPKTGLPHVNRRGYSRIDASYYLGISPSKFDEMRKDGRIGRARMIDGRKVWDIRDLDEAFEALPFESSEETEDWSVSA
jgi:hypothetical protein